MRILLLLLASATMLHAQSRDLQTLADWMEGDFSSAAQAAADTANYYDVRLHIARIWDERKDGYWFYVEQALGSAQERPYRQRFYHLVQRKDGKFASEVYTIDEPRRFAGAWYNGWLLEGITPDSLRLRDGCAVILAKKGNAFVGATDGRGCASDLRGAAYATSEVTITKNELLSWDRGYDAAGSQVWGATEGAYRFKRVGDGETGLRANLQLGLYHYWQYELDEAVKYFEQAVAADPSSADAHAWLADACRRSNQPERAEEEARAALAISPCNVFAHQTVADLYNPQFGEGGDFDSTAQHLDQALACDSTDGDLLMDSWIEAMRRGDRALERHALVTLARTGFITRGALALARWTLATLPKNAILLTGGDMDTYPLLALQETTGFRNDVTVVNLSLMNLPWYARLIRDRHDIPLLFDDAELDTLTPINSSEGRLFDAGQQIVARWFGAAYETDADEEMMRVAGHPIAVSITVDAMLYPVFDPAQPFFAGPYWTHEPNSATQLDTAAMREGLAGIDIDDFRGPFLSPRDRSPVRRATNGRDYVAIVQTALAYGNALREAGRTKEARGLAEWAERFVAASGTTDEVLPYIEELKQGEEQ